MGGVCAVWQLIGCLLLFALRLFAASSGSLSREGHVAVTEGRREYRPERCAYCEADTWCELRDNKKWQCRGCKVVRYFRYFLYPPIGYQLSPWAEKDLRAIYGNVDMATGLRIYRRAYLSMGKQNGKSFLTGGLPVYHLDCEDETDPEVCGAAAAKDQAAIVFKATAKIIRANPVLLQRFKVLDSIKRVTRRDNRGYYEVLSADGDLKDGIRPSLLIRDEIHRWKTQKAETLRDVTTKGQISRREPLDIQATTAGAEYESPLWWNEYQFAKLVQTDPTLAPDFYVSIFEADAKRVEEEPEYWKSREARKAANPSHEDFGGHLRDAAICAELNKALANASERSKYLRYHLNVPIKTQEDPVIDIPKWQACGGDVDLRTYPEYDFELVMRKWGLIEQPCWAGVDASWTIDLTAVVFVFPPCGASNAWSLLPFFFAPREKLPQLERITRMPFTSWVERGFVTATQGGAIDMRAVLERIRRGKEMFELREVPYDRVNFRTEAMTLLDEGIEAVEVQQNYMQLSYPTKFLLGAYPEKQIRHGNHPVLNWMAACLQLQYDQKDNCQPDKPQRLKSSKRIDGVQATVTALNRALLAHNEESVYARRGIVAL